MGHCRDCCLPRLPPVYCHSFHHGFRAACRGRRAWLGAHRTAERIPGRAQGGSRTAGAGISPAQAPLSRPVPFLLHAPAPESLTRAPRDGGCTHPRVPTTEGSASFRVGVNIGVSQTCKSNTCHHTQYRMSTTYDCEWTTQHNPNTLLCAGL